jgi:hypothetical protein
VIGWCRFVDATETAITGRIRGVVAVFPGIGQFGAKHGAGQRQVAAGGVPFGAQFSGLGAGGPVDQAEGLAILARRASLPTILFEQGRS